MTRPLRTSLPPSLAILAACDFLVLSGCFAVTAYLTEPSGISLYLLYQDGLLQLVLAVAAIQLTLYLERLYERFIALSLIFRQLWLALGVAFLFQALFASAHSRAQMPRWTMISGSLLVLVCFPLWRLGAGTVLRTKMRVRRILFLGATPTADEIAQGVQQQPELGLNAIGYVGREAVGTRLPRLGEDLDSAIARYGPEQIVIGRNTPDISVRKLLELQRAGARVEKLSSVYEVITGRISLSELLPARLIFSAELDARPGYVIARDIYSVVIGMVLLAVSSPMLAAAAIIVRLSSPGPIFEHDLRIGLKGSPIKLYRFRNHKRLKWLSRLKLTDLPLLLNIARGELSLIGPAPERPEFAAALRNQIPLYSHRLSVKPGLTGWEQIHRDPEEMPDSLEGLEYDLYYIKHLSPWLDAYIAILSLRSE